MLISAEQRARYDRQIILREIGESGQEKLRAGSVLVVGAGGLGAPALAYLVAAGVGRVGLIDDDVVELSNLQRQILFTSRDIGRSKARVRRGAPHGSQPRGEARGACRALHRGQRARVSWLNTR